LQLGGFAIQRGARPGHAKALVELAWVERQMGIPEWAQRAAAARPVLERLYERGFSGTSGDFAFPAYELARIAALHDDRDATRGYLRALPETGFARSWFLDRDPVFAAWRTDPEFLAIVQRLREHAAAERAKLADAELWP
jgi:hypothetical protein